MFSFNIPLLNRPILWYGFFFALGFFLGYWILLSILKRYFFAKGPDSKKSASLVAEKIALYTVLGTIIGARLGDVIFYESWTKIVKDPLSVLRFWEGGLASHGGAIGILIALFILSCKWKKERPQFSWVRLIDLVVIPTALAGGFIRIGNFMNQEILGKPTTLPWGVIFGHPVDGLSHIPRHPVQLYESFYYFFTFGLLYFLFSRYPNLRKPGKIGGLFLILIFGFRFCIEFLKVEQSALMPIHSILDMGQYLSIPMIIIGSLLFFSQELLDMRRIKRQ
jgi:prolipoprotein diacylglyceryl transferase